MIYQVKDLKFAYPGCDPVLGGISLTINEGDILTILGPNGAGKSTFFSCLLGILKTEPGQVALCGKDVGEMKEKEVAALVGYVPQSHDPSFGFTVFEYVLMGCASGVGLFERPGKKEEAAALKALETMGIESFAGRNYASLSGGERQQVTIARAIAQEPRAILFDEPTAHLDQGNSVKVLRMIKDLASKGYAVAVTTHDPDQALLLGGRAALFDGRGGAMAGSVKEIVTEENLKAVYGSDLKIRYLEEFGREICICPSL